jgi:hypothetical protein
MAAFAEITVPESAIGSTSIVLHPRTFKSGSVGYFATSKVETGSPDVRYQATITLVRIGSRPATPPAEAE